MSTNLSRRIFLGSSAALTGGLVAASGVIPIAAAAAPEAAAPPLVHYGPAPGIAKLNANENPYGPSPAALEAMFEASKKGAYYVGEGVGVLKSMIAERHGLTPEHVSLSSGSSGVLTYLAVAASKDGKILGPDLFWDTTTRLAIQQGGELLRLPKSEDLSIDLDAMEKAITDDVSLVHITNPNNPTGTVLDGEALRAFCKRVSTKTKVLVDEAYNELTDDPEFNSMVPLVKEGYDVVVARTFSKIYGLAGMRVGYLLASPENGEYVARYGLGDYAMNQAGVAAAIASYNDLAFLKMSKSMVLEARELVNEAIAANGLEALPSSTNFIFVNLGALNAEVFRQKMEQRGVLIRGIYRDYTNWSRVSMGRMEDVAKYAEALPGVLEAMSVADTTGVQTG